jgi:hypothetical protein
MSSESPSCDLGQKWRNETLKWHLQTRAAFIERLSEKLEHSQDYPTDTPPVLCKLISATAKTISEKVESIDATQYPHVSQLLQFISEHLRYVERSRIENTPWSMIQAAESFLKHQVGAKYHFIIRPQWANNYSVTGEFVLAYKTRISAFHPEVTARWKEILEESQPFNNEDSVFDQKLFCVSFPRVDRLNCLLHANWGHEVGHIIIEPLMQSEFPKLWETQKTCIRRRVEEEMCNSPSPLREEFQKNAIQQIIAFAVDQVMNIAYRGLAELLCDHIGLHLLGPASIASHLVFSAPHSLDENPLNCGNYPPWRYRLRLMKEACQDITSHLEDLKAHSILTPFAQWLEQATKLAEPQCDKDEINKNIATKEAYNFIETHWDDLRQQALQRLPPASKEYSLHASKCTIAELVQRLDEGIIPNETGFFPDTEPASFENILNAAWVFAIKKLQAETWGTADDFEKLFRLTLKAIESSFVQKVFGEKLKAAK